MEKATLIKVYPVKRQLQNGIEIDSILIFYRDENGVKKTQYIDRAEIPYYILKDKNSEEATTQPLFIEADKVEKVITHSDMIYRDIAMKTNTLAFYDDVQIKNGPYSSNMKNLFKHPLIYDADMDISDRYIRMFNDSHERDVSYKIHKGFFDIEVELDGYNGFPDEEIAPCPVTLISFLDKKDMVMYTMITRNPKNESLIEFEKIYKSSIDEFKERIANEYGVILSELKIIFFNTEKETMENFFNTVHKLDPDFLTAWNQSFDVITLQNRLKKCYSMEQKKSGIRPYDAMLNTVCDQKYLVQKDEAGNDVYLTPKAYFSCNKDKPFVDRMDYFNVLDGINFLDQMLVFANIRKSSGQRESYSLDAIAMSELGFQKLEFEPGETIKNISYKNYKKFCFYNIVDVLLLCLLEDKNLDFDMLQSLSDITNTRTEKVLKKTISLKNYISKFANENGFIMNNNKNQKYGNNYEIFEEKYIKQNPVIEASERYRELFERKENAGAHVGDPNLNTNKNGTSIIKGKNNKFILEDIFDEDFTALYPSIIQALNLSPTSQIGKFFLEDVELKQRLSEQYGYADLFNFSEATSKALLINDSPVDLGPTLCDSLQSMDFVTIGNQFMGLPTTEDLMKRIKDKVKPS